jgi:hypothetical protein
MRRRDPRWVGILDLPSYGLSVKRLGSDLGCCRSGLLPHDIYCTSFLSFRCLIYIVFEYLPS